MKLSSEDRLDIAELQASNFWALDLGDSDAFAATFVPDGTLQMRRTYHGREAIRAFVAEFRIQDVGFPRAQHLVSQLNVEGSGDRCAVRTYVTRVHRLPGQHRGNSQIIWSGYSADTCVKVDGRWLFASRALRAWEGDIAAEVSEVMGRAATVGGTG
jgi:hypothetical protein